MRVLFVTSPGIGHLFPAVNTAWALRVAGHDVVVATSGHHELVAKAGLFGVDVAPGVDFAAIFGGLLARHEGVVPGPAVAGEMFAEVSRPFLDRTVSLARTWRPDLVITSMLQGAGPLAAAAIGVPVIVHGINFGHPAYMANMVAERLAADYARFGATARQPAGFIDLAPPSMAFGEPAEHTISMRAVPYNAGAVVPDWVLEPRKRTRVVVTLGSVWGQLGGIAALKPFVAAAQGVDAEFVLALGGLDLSDLGELPPNLRPVDWIPLGALLANSDAVIHHGGAGTTLTALDAGLPQYVIPQGADQFMNADAVAHRGAGAVHRVDELDAEKLAALPGDPDLIRNAREVAAEMRTQRTPADVVPEIIALGELI